MRRVSVILCCYDEGDTVGRALESVYRQTLPTDRYEVLFINDGSRDASERVALTFSSHANFRYLAHGANRGLADSCNHGLGEAVGDYVIRLDADDRFEPTILEEMCAPLDRDETDFVYCDRREWVRSRQETRDVRLERFNLFHLLAIGTMMRRDLMLDIGGYRRLFWEEYDLYLRYLLKSSRPPYRIPRPLFTYTIREGSLTSNLDAISRGWEELKRLWPSSVLERFGRLPERPAGERATAS